MNLCLSLLNNKIMSLISLLLLEHFALILTQEIIECILLVFHEQLTINNLMGVVNVGL